MEQNTIECIQQNCKDYSRPEQKYIYVKKINKFHLASYDISAIITMQKYQIKTEFFRSQIPVDVRWSHFVISRQE
jgi:hypothetical protein